MEFIKHWVGTTLNVITAKRGKRTHIKYFTLFAHVLVTDEPLGCPPPAQFLPAACYATLIFDLSLTIIELIAAAVIAVTRVAALRSHDVLRGSWGRVKGETFDIDRLPPTVYHPYCSRGK
jgi:hypothetical protein